MLGILEKQSLSVVEFQLKIDEFLVRASFGALYFVFEQYTLYSSQEASKTYCCSMADAFFFDLCGCLNQTS